MTCNEILRRLRYTFNFSDSKMIDLFALGDLDVSRAQVSDWLKKDDDPAFRQISDSNMAIFLNGFINDKRGKREGATPMPEKILNNNIILRKLKIALHLKDDDIVAIFKLVDTPISKHEISAFFRHSTQHQYRDCQDQFMRNFLQGLNLKYRTE